MANIPLIRMNDGHQIPQFGIGVWQVSMQDIVPTLSTAFQAGYRHVDTAAAYDNEEGVGRAIAQSGLPRAALFVTTKLWNADQGYQSTLDAAQTSLEKLGLDYLDLYLIHWPCPAKNLFVDSWKALIELRRRGVVRSIGVSNFRAEDLRRIIDETGVVPAVNQIEQHPLLQQRELRAVHAQNGIITECWSPLAQGGELLRNPTLRSIADKHGKSVAQVVLRWHIELGLVLFPKSVTAARIRENIDIFDFSLDTADMTAIAALDAGRRIGPDPNVFSG